MGEAGVQIKRKILTLFLIAVLSTACASAIASPTPQLEILDIEIAPVIEVAPLLSVPLKSSPYSLEALRARTYAEGKLSVEYAWENQIKFTRYYITYPSDGLTIHGFVNIPRGKGPFPVIIALHGYLPPSEYDTRDYSTRYADVLARAGYIVLHPNMRNFPPSDMAARNRVFDYHTGYVVDVINLLEQVRSLAGNEGIFKNADLTHLGIWGHSLGGGIALRVLSVLPEVKAAVLYSAVSQRYSREAAGFSLVDFSASQAVFSIHHGEADETIDLSWSERLHQQLLDAGKDAEIFTYPGQPHTLNGDSDVLFSQRMVEFFDRNFRNN